VVCYASYAVGTYASHKTEPDHRKWLTEVALAKFRHARATERQFALFGRQVAIVEGYQNGETYEAIGKKHGISRQRVCQIVKKSGAYQPRPPGPKAQGETCFIDGMEVYDWLEHRLSSEHKAALAQVVAASSKLVGEKKNG
jgi:hypothetical protein